MRRLLALMMICSMMLTGACAQSTTMTPLPRGEQLAAPQPLTLFESLYGYTMWYNATKLTYAAPQEGESGDTFRTADGSAALSLTLYDQTSESTPEALIAENKQMLKEKGYTHITVIRDILYARQGDTRATIQFLTTSRGVYTIFAKYPLSAAQQWRESFQAMTESLRVQAPLRLSYPVDVPFITPQAENATAVLWADEALNDIKIYALSPNKNGYEKGTLLTHVPKLKAFQEGIALFDVFAVSPTLLAEFSDYAGVEHRVLLRLDADENRLLSQPCEGDIAAL